MINTPERPTAALERRRDLYVVKIQQEEKALACGTFGPGSPADYKFVAGLSREERLEEWKSILSEIKAELLSVGIDTSHMSNSQKRPSNSSSAPREYTVLPNGGRGNRDGRINL
jgi:hypothetical protein